MLVFGKPDAYKQGWLTQSHLYRLPLWAHDQGTAVGAGWHPALCLRRGPPGLLGTPGCAGLLASR